MNSVLKTSLTSLLLMSVAFGGVATVATFASADAAYAKSENAGKKSGESRGKSSEARGKKGNSNEWSATRGKSGGNAKAKIKVVPGKEKRAAQLSAGAEVDDSADGTKGRKPAKSAFHPSELGNMNGALNANINAVLAHIRNGNGNGPVGHVAVLAVASAKAEGADDIVELEAAYEVLEIELEGYGGLEGYFDALDEAEMAAENPAIEDALAMEPGAERDLALEAAFVGTEFEGLVDPLGAYEGSLIDARENARDPLVESALTNAGYDEISGDFAAPRPSVEDPDGLDQAFADLEAESQAENDILAYWNKNPGGDPESESGLTAAEQQLLEDLRARFSEDDLHAIKDTAGIVDEEVADGGIDDCAALDEACEADGVESL